MSQEHLEIVRRVYSGRARGNWEAEAEIFATDAICTWETPEGRIVSHGVEEATRNLRAFLRQWAPCRAGEAPEGRIGPQGVEEATRNLRAFLRQWEHFRVEADEFIEVDERSVLV